MKNISDMTDEEFDRADESELIESLFESDMMSKKSAFITWLDTFVSEKGLDTDHVFEVEGKDWGTNYIPLDALIEAIKGASDNEKNAIKDTIVKIDFYNGDVMDYFKHLAKAIAL